MNIVFLFQNNIDNRSIFGGKYGDDLSWRV